MTRRRQHPRLRRGTRRVEHGSVLVEGMAALLVLCLLFFGLMQIQHWCMQMIFCDYASYYAAKANALGFKDNFALRAARVAAAGISGMRTGRTDQNEEQSAELYMRYGDRSGVRYDYWYPQSSDAPTLYLSGSNKDDSVVGTVTLKNAPLLHERLAAPLGVGKAPEPTGSTSVYNWSKLFME